MPNKVLFGPEKLATTSTPGLLKASGSGSGLQLDSSGYLKLSYPGASTIKAGSNLYAPVVVGILHESVFYGLAKAAGDSTQAASSNAVGTYTDNAKTSILNMLSVAPINNPVFTGSISLGRFYDSNNSSNEYNTIGTNSIAIGGGCVAAGDYSLAFGINILAKGKMSFVIGNGNAIYGDESFSGGWSCNAYGEDQFVFGTLNYSDSWDNIPTWTPNTTYHVGDRVKYDMPNNNTTTRCLFLCMSENTDETFNSAHWFNEFQKMKYVEIIGNGYYGVQDAIRSNARALDWDGNEYLKGYLYVGCNADSSGGTRVPHDIQIDGTSIVNNGVANIPIASSSTIGAVKTATAYGTAMIAADGIIKLELASSAQIKEGTQGYKPIVPEKLHEAVFYGLAKAAGDSTQAASTYTVGTYTASARSYIYRMLNAHERVTGTTTPSLSPYPGTGYIFGEITSLTVTVPTWGCIDIVFKSGSTPTTLTITPTKTGVTAINWANGFDPAALEANTTYEINILDGEYGVACKWT